MHSFLRTQLENTYQTAKGAAAPRALRYLQLFGPIHNQWHGPGLRRLGFLTFHWYVVRDFKRIRGPQYLGGTGAYTRKQLSNMGQPYDADVAVPSGGLTELQNFTMSMEGWHDDAHMAISMNDGVNLMNPLTNIFIPQFWKLHFFINKRFEEKLRAYGRGVVSNPTPARIIEYIETNFHWTMPAI